MAAIWGPRLYRYLARLAPDPETARDLTQETLVRALRAFQGGALPDDLQAWLFRVATNLARDEHKSAYRQRVTLFDSPDPPGGHGAQPGPEQRVLEASVTVERQRAVQRALQGLAPELREVVVLRFCEDLPVKAIAGIVGIPEGTVKSRLYRAYRILEASLAAWRPSTDGGNAHG